MAEASIEIQAVSIGRRRTFSGPLANSPSTGRPSSFSPFLSCSVGRGHGGYKTSSCSAGRCFCWFMRYISADTNDSAPYLQWSPQGGIGVMRLHRSTSYL